MGNVVYSFQNFNHPGGWAIHAPFAGGKLDATTAFQVKHGNSYSVIDNLKKYKIGYVGNGNADG